MFEDLRGFIDLGVDVRENGRWVLRPNGCLGRGENLIGGFFLRTNEEEGNEYEEAMKREAIEEWN